MSNGYFFLVTKLSDIRIDSQGTQGKDPNTDRQRMFFRYFNNNSAYNELQAVRQASAEINPGMGSKLRRTQGPKPTMN